MLKLLRYLKPFAPAIVVACVLLFFQALADLALPTLMADIVNIGVIKADIPYIWQVGAVMLLVAGGSAVCSVGASYLAARAAVGFGRDLRRLVFARVEGFSLHEFDRIGPATLITRTTNDITQVQMVTVMILRMMVSAPLMAIGGVIMAASKDATLSLLFVVILPVLAGLILLIAAKGIPLFQAMQVKLDTLNRVLRESLTGVRVIRAFDRVDYEHQRFEEANRDLTDTAIKVNQLLAIMMPALMLITNLTSIAIVWFGGLRVDAGEMQIGDMMAFIQYAMQIMFSLLMVTFMFVLIPRAEASAVRINEVLNTAAEIVDPLEPMRLPAGPSATVEFQDVTFGYPGAEEPAVSHISFRADPGKVTAIIGGTGSGKSTLINLIPRLYDVDEGRVLVDGIDVRLMAQADLRARIGLVPQQAILFTGTVAENLLKGRESATDEELERAAETAQASDFIQAMKDGYAAEIAQGGLNLSGGQKQRLAIARALVRKPAIYLFDDTFSALDFKTDARLRAALKEETTRSTMLIVAQRVSTVMDADQIIVLDEGQIVGIGKHDQLVASCPVYREIVSSQLGEVLAL